MLKASFLRSYRSKKGNNVFVYGVSGTPQALERFAEAQGDKHRTDEQTGVPLWFTTRFFGQTGELLITSNNNVVPNMDQFNQADSLAKQYGGNLGQELARVAASQLLGVTPAPQPAPAPKDVAHDELD